MINGREGVCVCTSAPGGQMAPSRLGNFQGKSAIASSGNGSSTELLRAEMGTQLSLPMRSKHCLCQFIDEDLPRGLTPRPVNSFSETDAFVYYSTQCGHHGRTAKCAIFVTMRHSRPKAGQRDEGEAKCKR